MKDTFTASNAKDLALDSKDYLKALDSVLNDQNEPEKAPIVFWYYSQKDSVYKIDHGCDLQNFLIENGFRNYKRDDRFYIWIQDNIIQKVETVEIKQFLKEYILSLDIEDKEKILSALVKGSRIYLASDILDFLPFFGGELLTDTKDQAYYCYLNGFVVATKDGYELKPYSELPKPIWRHSIIQREFKFKDITGFDFTMNAPTNHDYNFMHFLCKTANDDQSRYSSLLSLLGYLQHRYFDYTMKAVSLTDMKISEYGEANGRSGKTLIGKSIAQIRNLAEINGKNFNLLDKHRYSQCTNETETVFINDLDMEYKKFDAKGMFNDITEGIEVDQKNRQPFKLRSKILITSNKVIQGEGDSHTARFIEFEVSSFFSAKNQVDKYYNDWFFSKKWTASQWTIFDNIMIYSMCYFLKNGLIETKTVNLEQRKFIEGTCSEFVEFSENRYLTNVEYFEKQEIQDFKNDYSEFQFKKWFGMKKFKQWLRHLARSNGWRVTEFGMTSNKKFTFEPI